MMVYQFPGARRHFHLRIEEFEGMQQLRVFAGGIATETNTFCPVLTGLDDFAVQRSDDASARESASVTFDLPEIWGTLAEARGDDFFFSLMAWAQPAGITKKSAYESLRDELLRDLQAAMPIDTALLMLHGAMIAQGYEDCEEDIIRRVRDIIGPNAVIGVELDLHCHLTYSKLERADIVITYKEYPHTDINDRARELFHLSIESRRGRFRPTMTLYDCQMVGQFPTSRQPLRGIIDAMMQAEKRKGILSISFAHGFPFADMPHVGAKMLVVTDNDPNLALQVAEEFGLRLRAVRQVIGFDSISLPMDAALRLAMQSDKHPVVVADQSDNAGAGAPSDATYALRWLIERDAQDAAVAILYDPEVVKIAKKAGVGAAISVRLGGKTGRHSGDPLDLDVTVVAIASNHVHPFPQAVGEPVLFSLGDVAALRRGSIDIVVCSMRCQCYSPCVFSELGIDPKVKRILVVKSTQHFYGAFASIAAEVVYMAGPGAVSPDPRQIAYTRLDTQALYPWTGR
jgi:microcystin degradation protein MlrC